MKHIIITIAGILSSALIYILTFISSIGVDGGWTGMFVMYFGTSIVCSLHLIVSISYIYISVIKIKNKKLLEHKIIILPLVYYVLIPTLYIVLTGFRGIYSIKSLITLPFQN